MGKRKNYRTWTTEDEIAFIDSLGEHGYGGAIPYCDLLKKYVETAASRIAWGAVDREKVISYAHSRILECKKRGEEGLPRCRCSFPHAYNVGVA